MGPHQLAELAPDFRQLSLAVFAGFVAFPIRDVDKCVGAVNPHDFTVRPHEFRDFEGCFSKPAADVENFIFITLPNAEVTIR